MKILCTILLTALLGSCAKNEVVAKAPNVINPDEKLIQSIIVEGQGETTYEYNDDNTLKELVFKTGGKVQYTESFTYRDGKIVESLKQSADGSTAVKKEYKYEGDLIVEQTERVGEESIITSSYKYDKHNFLEKVITEQTVNGYDDTKVRSIERVEGENKIIVKQEGVATHHITFDDKRTPEAAISGYQAIVQINNNGIAGNILLLEVFVGDKCSTIVSTNIEFDTDGTTVLNSKTRYKSNNLDEIQNRGYNY